MSDFVLILLLLAGMAFLFLAGYLISHITKLDKEYDEMMNKGGNIPDTKS